MVRRDQCYTTKSHTCYFWVTLRIHLLHRDRDILTPHLQPGFSTTRFELACKCCVLHNAANLLQLLSSISNPSVRSVASSSIEVSYETLMPPAKS